MWIETFDCGKYRVVITSGGASLAGVGWDYTSPHIKLPELKPSDEELKEIAEALVQEHQLTLNIMQAKGMKISKKQILLQVESILKSAVDNKNAADTTDTALKVAGQILGAYYAFVTGDRPIQHYAALHCAGDFSNAYRTSSPNVKAHAQKFVETVFSEYLQKTKRIRKKLTNDLRKEINTK